MQHRQRQGGLGAPLPLFLGRSNYEESEAPPTLGVVFRSGGQLALVLLPAFLSGRRVFENLNIIFFSSNFKPSVTWV